MPTQPNSFKKLDLEKTPPEFIEKKILNQVSGFKVFGDVVEVYFLNFFQAMTECFSGVKLK